MNLNSLAISLIELDPENLSDLEEFKKNLVLTISQSEGYIKEILSEACSEIDALFDKSPELRRAGIANLGVLLEKIMGNDDESVSVSKSESPRKVVPERTESRILTLSKEFDTDLLNEFITENTELVNMTESAIMDCEKDPNSQELLNTIFRGFHTIKGTSAFLNLDCIKDLAHHVESMLSRIRDGEDDFTSGHADLSLRALDLIKNILQRMKSSGPGQQIELPLGREELHEELRIFMSKTRERKISDQSEKSVAQPGLKELLTKKNVETSPDQPPTATQVSDLGVESTVRVKIDRLDKLLDTVGELVIAQTMVGQDEQILNGKNHDLNKKISQAGKIVRELHDLSMFLRMVPMKGTFQRMMRLARDLGHKSGKNVTCITEGDDIEIDRNMVDMVVDPLVHLIRNAVDHGIEMPEERRRAGKPEKGQIRLTAGHVEGSIMLTIEDDGRGMNRQNIINKAIERGLIDSADRMTDQEILQMIFLPGFSTAKKVTDISGRGVGMDVVRQGVEALRGRIEVQTQEGQGCTFVMRMPLTMAITDGLIVKVGSQRYILPTFNIFKAVKTDTSDIHTVNQRAEMLFFGDELVPVIRLHRLFNIPDAQDQLVSGLLVIIGEGQQRCALFVDDILGQTQVVTKLLGKGIGNVPGVAGGAIMGDGTVGLILDATGIVNIARQQVNVTN